MQITNSRNNLTIKFNISEIRPLAEKLLNASVSDNFCKNIFNQICNVVQKEKIISQQLIKTIIQKYKQEII